MKKLFLVMFALILYCFPLMAYTESEVNDTPPVADVIPTGFYQVTCIGSINPEIDVDWYTYHVNPGNPIVVTILYASVPPTLYVDVCTDNPMIVQFTLNLLSMPSNTFIAGNGNMHYIKVYSTGDINDYEVLIQNLEDPTLPVVLSSFSGTFNSGFVGLQWTTQSETELSGYNILRSETSNLATASRVNLDIIPSTNTSNVHQYSYHDQEIEPNLTYYYWLEAVNMNGSFEHYGPVTVSTDNPGDNDTPEITDLTKMEPSYPNPFISATTLKFRLKTDMKAKLEIYNLKGQRIRSIFAGELEKGIHSYMWDGRNQYGSAVSSGIYLGYLTTPDGTYTTKLYLTK